MVDDRAKRKGHWHLGQGQVDQIYEAPNRGHKRTCTGGGDIINGVCQECNNDVYGPPTDPATKLTSAVVDRQEIALSRRKVAERPLVRVKPQIQTMLWDAYSILHAEMQHLKHITEAGEALTDKQASRLQKHIDALSKLAREEREQAKLDNPAELSDEELLEAADRARKLLQGEDV